MKSVIIIAIAFVLLIPLPVFAQESLISIQTDDNSYTEGDTIVISGNVSTVIGSSPVVIQIIHETTYVHLSQIAVAQDGSFTETVIAEGPAWENTGEYTVRASYQDQIAETEFSYTPKSELIETTSIFEVDAGSSGTFDVKYSIKGGTVENMVIDSNIFGLIVQIESRDEGTITLDLPREFIGAEKHDGTDDTFIILIDGIEVAYNESDLDFVSRIITIDFEEGDSDIEIIGSYVVGASNRSSPYGGGSGIGDYSTLRIIPDKPNVGSTIRVVGQNFSPLFTLEFLIDENKISEIKPNSDGSFSFIAKISSDMKADRVEFIIKDTQDNERIANLRIGEIENRIQESPNIPFTAEIAVSSESDDPPEPPCGGGTELVNGICQPIQTKKLGIVSFVDKTKDPQSYIDRYNSEPAYKKWFDENYPEYDSIEQAVGLELTKKIPDWVKNIFGWYAQDQVSEDELLNAIKYLINEKILVVD